MLGKIKESEDRGEERWKILGLEKNRESQALRREVANLRDQLGFLMDEERLRAKSDF